MIRRTIQPGGTDMLRNRPCSWMTLARAWVAVVVAPAAATGQTTPEDVGRELASLRRELQALRAEVESLKAERTGPAAAGPQTETSTDAAQGPTLPAPLNAPAPDQPVLTSPSAQVLAQQIAELSQVKVESASRMPVRLFGTLHASAFFNSGEANWLDNPNIVAVRPADARAGTFSMGVRQTRLGLAANGPTLGSFRTSGTVVADFFGGVPGFQTGQVMPLPRLLVGFSRLETNRSAIHIGQDHVVLAPRDPTSLAAFAFPSLFRSGNLYLRAPQVRVERALGVRFRAAGALVAPIGGDFPGEDYRFVPPALPGERSRRPAIEGRLAFDSTTDVDAPRVVSVGVSGHHGSERRVGGSAQAWAAALDFALRRDRVGIAGEVFRGENIDAFGGATGLDARASGGWAELQLFASPRLSFHGGAGLDELRGVRSTALPRRRNRSAYGSVIVSLTPELQGSFEYRWLATLPGAGSERRNHHVDWVLAYKF
jgi:hypothetical protein